jgi:hypothetical protein
VREHASRNEQFWRGISDRVGARRLLARTGPRGTLKMLVGGAGQIKLTKVRTFSKLNPAVGPPNEQRVTFS